MCFYDSVQCNNIIAYVQGVLTMSDIFRVLARRPNLGTTRSDDGTPFVSKNFQWGEDYEPDNQWIVVSS